MTLASVLVLVAAGCGGSSSSGGSTSTTSTGAPASSAPASSSPAPSSSGSVAKVVMKNIQFSPKTLTVKKGTTVEWTNEDSLNHDVTKSGGPGPTFASGTGNIGSGGTYKQTFNVAGTIQYHCTIHPGMTGTIVVK